MAQFPLHRAATIGVDLTPGELIAVAAALRIMDDTRLEEEGILPHAYPNVASAFEKLDALVTKCFGEGWPALVVEPSVLIEEYEAGEDA